MRLFHIVKGTKEIMHINIAVCFFFLSLLINNFYCRASDDFVQQRLVRGDLSEYIEDDPNFWPVRGRRDGKDAEMLYFGASEGPFPYHRGGRKSKEEGAGVFWAGRGRSLDANEALDSEEGDFWAHRGRSAETENEESWNSLPAQEPGWIWLIRRDARTMHAKLMDGNSCSGEKPYKNGKREISKQKVCNLKRKSNNLLREIPRSDQFWPVRGKKLEYPGLRSKRPTKALPTIQEDDPFWPLRGKREKESLKEDMGKLNSAEKLDGFVKEETKLT